MDSLYTALFSPFIGLKMIFKDRTLFLSSIIPLIVNVLLYIVFAIVVYNYYGDVLALIIQDPDSFIKSLLYWFLFVFLLLLALMVFVLSFNVLGSILLSPFNSLIAKASYRLMGFKLRKGTKTSFLKDMYTGFKLDLKKLIFIFIPLGLLFIVSFFLPILSIFTLVLSFWAISYQYMDYIMQEERLATKDRLRLVFLNPVQTLAFGFVVSVIVSIPVLGLAVLPSSVVGGTMLFSKLKKLA